VKPDGCCGEWANSGRAPGSSASEGTVTRGRGAGRQEWSKDGAFFALYPVPNDVINAGLAPLWRLCHEAQALATFALAHTQHLPELNAKGANDSLNE
jgi:hypothetical protein